jgi:CRP-like cAMP-binding protein/GT2 family glycosyltransferase
MKTVMVIPTYWARESSTGWQEGDAVYDHPTPLDQEGTLRLALDSLAVLEAPDFSLVILACATSPDIEDAVEARVADIVRSSSPTVSTYVVSHSHLRELQAVIMAEGNGDLAGILSLTGYANIRNMCLFVPYVLGAEVVVLIDDDEIFDDPQFMTKAGEFIGRRFMGQTIDGIAGYYMNPKGSYYDDVPDEIHWMTYWDRFGSKREAFDQVIPGEPRLKLTPFAFGGCMVIHRSLFRSVPFDPRIARGEDTDYVINARMFGFDFFLDNELYIQHRPPTKTHPTWRRFREDIFRLLYTKAKIDGQTPETNMTTVTAEDFDPYPGEFLKDSLADKILKSNLILALDYLANDRVSEARETIRNIWLANTEAIPKGNPFQSYLQFQQRWRALRKLTFRELHESLHAVIEQSRLDREEEQEAEPLPAQTLNADASGPAPPLESVPFFEGLHREQVEKLFSIGERMHFDKDEVILKEGSLDSNLYVILRGNARIVLANDSEESMELIEVGDGEVLGEVSLLIDAPHAATVTALEPTEVIRIERKKLNRLAEDAPELAAQVWHQLAVSLGTRLRDTDTRYLSHVRETHDVADRMLGTAPLEEGEPDSEV